MQLNGITLKLLLVLVFKLYEQTYLAVDGQDGNGLKVELIWPFVVLLRLGKNAND